MRIRRHRPWGGRPHLRSDRPGAPLPRQRVVVEVVVGPRGLRPKDGDAGVEVVSPDDPDRDLVEKRADYAEGGIPEYWIADPRDETITVLALAGDEYVEHGVFGRGGTATSPLLEGFVADVSAVFDAPKSGA